MMVSQLLNSMYFTAGPGGDRLIRNYYMGQVRVLEKMDLKILQEKEYQAISAIPYERPEHPGELNIPLGTPQHESNRLRSEYKEELKLFIFIMTLIRQTHEHITYLLDPRSEYPKCF